MRVAERSADSMGSRLSAIEFGDKLDQLPCVVTLRRDRLLTKTYITFFITWRHFSHNLFFIHSSSPFFLVSHGIDKPETFKSWSRLRRSITANSIFSLPAFFNAAQRTVSIKISFLDRSFPFLVVFRITEEIDYLSMIKPQGKALEIASNFDSILV